jgi:C1A family cysteine protease
MTDKKRLLNYKFQKVDSRDFKLKIIDEHIKATSSIDSFSLQPKIKTIYDQGDLGSCVSNAFAQYINMGTKNNIRISRLLHYYCGRAIEGDSSLEDNGLDIRQAASIIKKYGACNESVWSYDTSKFNSLPPLSVFKSSLLFKKYSYSFVNQNITSLTSVLYSQKLPIIFGISVYDSFYDADTTGIVPMPDTTNETLQGGHCILMVGYNNATRRFTCVNSWGASWGNRGFFTIPYEYVLDPSLAADFCCLNFLY